MVGSQSEVASQGGDQEQAVGLKDLVWADGTASEPPRPHASSAFELQKEELALMLHGTRISATYWTSLHTIRWESQPNNFPFPHREIILGRCLALLALCKGCFTGLTGTSRRLANGSVQACIYPKAHES